MKKIPTQSLANSLGLSRVTVWKVLNDKPGVSSETVQRVLDATKKMMEEEDSNPVTQQHAEPSKRISLLASRADTSSFWMRMVDQIASELHHRRIQLNYIPIDIMNLSIQDLKAMVHPSVTDGLIIINIYEENLLQLLQQLPNPKVYFDTIPGYSASTLQGDLVLLEGRDLTAQITKGLARKGCRRIGFIGDTHYAYTNLLRWYGFQDAMQDLDFPLEETLCLTGPIGKDSYKERIGEFLNSLPQLPDAFVCASDYVAFIVLSLLSAKGYRVPEDIRLTGYDDSQDFLLDNHEITTVHVHNDLLGKRMVHQLLYRIENPSADFEEISICPKILDK